jgi:hypothetical protein
MYMVFSGNKPAGNIKHMTYEEARNRLRRMIRKMWHNGQKHLPLDLVPWNIRKV